MTKVPNVYVGRKTVSSGLGFALENWQDKLPLAYGMSALV